MQSCQSEADPACDVQLVVEVSCFVLLFGTLINGWQQQGATFLSGAEFIQPNLPQEVLSALGGVQTAAMCLH